MEVVRKKPGRKPGKLKAETKIIEKVETRENADIVSHIINTQAEEKIAVESIPKSNRPKRTPLFKQRTLIADEREGYIRRWVLEKPGRVEAFQKAGWNFVEGNIKDMRDSRAQNASQIGSIVKEVVNPNARDSAKDAYLMEISKDWYEEDQLAKRQVIRDREAALDPKKYRQKDRAFYGSMETKIEE